MNYIEWQPSLHPTPLRGVWGVRWGASFGAAKDAVLALAKDAVKAGFVLQAPADALSLLGADTELEQLTGESDEDFRGRLAEAWETWRLAGTRQALVIALDQLGLTVATIYTTRDWLPDAPPDGRSDLWARWWILIQGHPWSLDLWDEPGTWDDGGTWDTDATPDDVARVTGLLRKWSNARDLGYVRLLFGASGDVWGPEEPWDSGTWDAESATFVDWRVS